MNIGYFGPLKDHSGYGEASRHHVAALTAAGVTVVPKMARYTMDNSNFGEIGNLVDRLLTENKELDYDIKLLHTTPNVFDRYIERGKYHIGFMYWETTRIPEDFADGLRLCDEVWTGSRANVDAIRAAGVTVPVFVFPQAIETLREPVKPYELPGFDGKVLYSIFEWTDRKNPKALLEAFWREFTADDNVGLLLKTYFRNFTYANKRMIREQLVDIKQRVMIESGRSAASMPPVYLYTELMDRRQVQRIHATGDVFVSAHRGEGWGIPQVEAMLAGNPIVSTNYGGVHEYLRDTKNAWLVPFEFTKVRGMTHSSEWYNSSQKWAEVDPEVLRSYMRGALQNLDYEPNVGRNGQEFVKKSLNLEVVGKLMADRLATIGGK